MLRDALLLALGGGGVLAASNAAIGPWPLLAGIAGAAIGLPALRRLLPPGTARAARGLPAAIATKTLFSFAFFAADAFLPLALVEVQGRSIAFAGLLMTAGALSWTAGSFVQARYATRASAPLLATAAAATLLTGLLLSMGALSAGAPLAGVFVGWTLAGLGMGIGTNTANATAMARTQPGREGATSTALGMADAIGVAAATGLGGAVMAAGVRAGADTGASLAGLWGIAIAAVFLIAPAGWRMGWPEPQAGWTSSPVTPPQASSSPRR